MRIKGKWEIEVTPAEVRDLGTAYVHLVKDLLTAFRKMTAVEPENEGGGEGDFEQDSLDSQDNAADPVDLEASAGPVQNDTLHDEFSEFMQTLEEKAEQKKGNVTFLDFSDL